MPRPSKLTAAAQEEFLKGLRLGLTRKAAAALAGWGSTTFEDYCQAGRQAIAEGRLRDPKAMLVEAMGDAEAQFQQSAVAVIVNAAAGNKAILDSAGNVVQAGRAPSWQAAAWLLERRFPMLFAQRRMVMGENGEPVKVRAEVTVPTAEALLEEVRRVKAERQLLELPPGTATVVGRPGTNGR